MRDFAFYVHNLTCAPWLKPTMMKIISASPVSIEGFPASLIGLFENIGIILTAGMTFRSRRKSALVFGLFVYILGGTGIMIFSICILWFRLVAVEKHLVGNYLQDVSTLFSRCCPQIMK